MRLNWITAAALVSVVSIYAAYSFVGLSPTRKSDLSIVGIDVSHHNRVHDWASVKKSAGFCIMKATEGSRFKDSKFNSYWASCKRHKIAKGAYHFFTPGIPAEAQFNNFKNRVKLTAGDFPPVLDVELRNSDMVEVNKWLKLAEAHYGVKPIVYTEYLFFKVFIDGNIDESYPLWIYVDQKFGVKPTFSGHDCVLWQYSHTGRVDGISGEVDLDAFSSESKPFSEILMK